MNYAKRIENLKNAGRVCVVNRKSKWGISGYTIRDGIKSNLKWVDLNHASEEATLWGCELINKLKGE